ncbi:phosphopantetheine-binding protein [Streptomyces sp. NPDC052051]|uniref:phosphopantetheine-binding protein n=1 Tax=Streptomyces sp. NPDC052051 TaxID=3154649 RepID=UPI00343800BD
MSDTPTTTPVTRESLRETVAGLLNISAADIADDANLAQLGLKSLHLMQLVNEWRRAGRTVGFRDLSAEPTIEAWAKYLGEAGA